MVTSMVIVVVVSRRRTSSGGNDVGHYVVVEYGIKSGFQGVHPVYMLVLNQRGAVALNFKLHLLAQDACETSVFNFAAFGPKTTDYCGECHKSHDNADAALVETRIEASLGIQTLVTI